MNIFASPTTLYFLARTTKDIIATLQLFGQPQRNKSYFVSAGTGLNIYPDEGFRADFYIYAIGIAGTADVSFNGNRTTIRANDFFAAIPATIVQVHGHSKDFKAKVLIFERSFLLKNIMDARQLEHLGFFNFDTLAHVSLLKTEAGFLKQKLDTIESRSRETGMFHDSIMQSLIINLLFETAEVYFSYRGKVSSKKPIREEELFIKFMKLVNASFRHEQALSFYADKLFVSSKYLIQVCKEISGKTPGSLIAEAMLAEAKLLLANPDNNISDVGSALGYNSVAAFSKFFRKQTGMAPSAFRG